MFAKDSGLLQGTLELLVGALRRQAGHDRPGLQELGGVVAEAARLGCAAARAWDLVPVRRQRLLAGPPCPRVCVENEPLGRLAVEKADGEPVFDTPLARALTDAGFRPTARGLRLRGRDPAPHTAEELWHMLGHAEGIDKAS